MSWFPVILLLTRTASWPVRWLIRISRLVQPLVHLFSFIARRCALTISWTLWNSSKPPQLRIRWNHSKANCRAGETKKRRSLRRMVPQWSDRPSSLALPGSNSALLTHLVQVLSGEQSLPDEVGTPGRVNREALRPSYGPEAPFADNRRKRRKVITMHLTGSDHNEGELFEFTRSSIQQIFVVADHRRARRDEEVSINDGHDVEHAIEISDWWVAFEPRTYVSAELR